MGFGSVDVIVPTYRPGRELWELLERIGRQTVSVNKIILMNTEKGLFEEVFSEEELTERFPNLEIHHLTRAEFDHGGTRRRGVALSEAEVFVLFTQDALPAEARLLENLIGSLERDEVAVAYGRQLAKKSSGVLERISREFNYPEESVIKGKADLERLGIKTYFCSNVCAAYRRDVYEKIGGFVEHTIFNEDMIYAAKVVENGYKIRYAAEARVYHAHNYSCLQQFHRNFDLGVSQAQYREVFEKVPSESEGKKLVKTTIKALCRKGRPDVIPYFFFQCAAKYAGYRLGKSYRKLPKRFILWASDNKAYWK